MNDAAPLRLAADSASRQRARGEARVRFARAGARSAAERAFETGGLRLRFPRSDAECEAVLVNTGGGMAGGDRASIAVEVGANARALVTTQSAEKIYRCEGEPARVETRLSVEPGGSLVWAPQETLLFEQASLERRLDAEVAADASLLIVEAAVFGRLASGETDVAARLHDRWRIRRAGRLVFAEALRLADAAAALDRPAPRSYAWRPTPRRRRPICGRRWRRSPPGRANASTLARAASTAWRSRASFRPRQVECARR